MNINGLSVIRSSNIVTLRRICPFCKKTHEVEVDAKAFDDRMKLYAKGMHVQDAFPTFTPSQREMILTGICDECWSNL